MASRRMLVFLAVAAVLGHQISIHSVSAGCLPGEPCATLANCGDGRCQRGVAYFTSTADKPYLENGSTCPLDCPVTCGDGFCDLFETYNKKIPCTKLDCLPTCGDGICQQTGSKKETIYNCNMDCGYCGDLVCNPGRGENSTNCNMDCRIPDA